MLAAALAAAATTLAGCPVLPPTSAWNPRWDDDSIQQLERVPATAFEAVRHGRRQR